MLHDPYMPFYLMAAFGTIIAIILLILLLVLPPWLTPYKTATHDEEEDTYRARIRRTTLTTEPKVITDDKTGAVTTEHKLRSKKTTSQTKLLVKDSAGLFVSNGKYVFYAKRGKPTKDVPPALDYREHTIYRMKIRSKSQKKVVTGTNIVPQAVKDPYVYYGKLPNETDDSPASLVGNLAGGMGAAAAALAGTLPGGAENDATLFVRNWKTKKTRQLAGEHLDGFCGERVVCHAPADAGSAPLYTYKLNGTGMKELTALCTGDVKIKGKRIIYLASNETNTAYRAYSCLPTGAETKELSEWSPSLAALKAEYL